MKTARILLVLVLATLMVLGPNGTLLICRMAHAQPLQVNPPRNYLDLASLVEDLLLATDPAAVDTDEDGLPDPVEAVIGTDPDNPDSDFDDLNDAWEIAHDLDPLEPDSNYDGLPDYYESVAAASEDIDQDGMPNAWDFDNDDDGVSDGFDLSPDTKTDVLSSFAVDLETNQKPLFVTFQITPENPDHLKLFHQKWDWPEDAEGNIKDTDGSHEDVYVIPVLEVWTNEPPAPDAVNAVGIAVDGNIMTIPLLPVTEHGRITAFTAYLPYTSGAPAWLSIETRLQWRVVCLNDADDENPSAPTGIATYYENFVLAGFSVEESSGTDVGLISSEALEPAVSANLLLAYQFLRNDDNTVADIPGLLSEHAVAASVVVTGFPHKEEALVTTANENIPQLLSEASTTEDVPVIMAMEDRVAVLGMAQMQQLGSPGSFEASLLGEPLKRIKTLKTTWYDPLDYEPTSTEAVLSRFAAMSLDEEAAYSLMSLMMYWTTGEQRLINVASPQPGPPPEYDRVPDVLENIAAGGLSYITVLYRGALGNESLSSLESYKSLEFMQLKGWSTRGGSTLPNLAKLGDVPSFKTWIRQCDNIAESSKYFKKIAKYIDYIDAAALVLDTGFAAVSIADIARSSLSGMELNGALLKTTMQLYLSVSEMMIGMVPYVGWMMAIIMAISDTFGDWSGDLLDWLAGLFTNVNYRMQPAVEIIGDPEIDVTDLDGNGFDVGDRIEYRSRLKGTVTGKSGYWDLVTKSEFWPFYEIAAPGGSLTPRGSLYTSSAPWWTDGETLPIPPQSTWTINTDESSFTRSTEYEAGVWVEPGIAMVNYPVNVNLQSAYRLYYTWSHFVFLVFYWTWCHHESAQSGISQGGGTTLYFDVLPGTLDEFVQWRSITKLDTDGDGLPDSEETDERQRLRYDTDGDGLNDKFEREVLTDGQSHDTDGDGLVDWFELQYGTDPLVGDTDGDGLGDYIEIAGWKIDFAYQGQQFSLRVNSSPMTADSDGDGLNDKEEYDSGLNPRSGDTNGDGTPDLAGESAVDFVRDETFDLSMLLGVEGGILDVDMDAAGNVYVLTVEDSNRRITKYSPEATAIWSRDISDPYVGSIAIDEERRCFYSLNPLFTYDPTITVRDFDWNVIDEITLGSQYKGLSDVYVDAQGKLFVTANVYTGLGVYVIDPDTKTVIAQFGESGDEIHQFKGRINLAIDNQTRTVYVSEYDEIYGSRIMRWRYDNDYQFIYINDIPTSESGAFDFISGINTPIAVATDSTLFVADPRRDRLLMFDRNGVFLDSEYAQHLETLGSLQLTAHNSADMFYYAGSYMPSGFESAAWVARYFVGSEETPSTASAMAHALAAVNGSGDTDGDGLTDEEETSGWEVHFESETGGQSVHALSSPFLGDTDFDGLSDFEEFQRKTNPANPDTDNDGEGDFSDPHPLAFDADGDGLADGVEVSLGLDCENPDTDSDGIDDGEELSLGTSPKNGDTDGDGLGDLKERVFGSDPMSPDSDGDFLFDRQEMEAGSDFYQKDTDGDGLDDGYEVMHQTDPTLVDTDGDGLNDQEEITNHLDPTSPDTDGDGINDGDEFTQGTAPRIADSDGDGIADGQDLDSGTHLVENIAVAADSEEEISGLLAELRRYTHVEFVQADQLSTLASKPRILLVGRPDGDGVVDATIHDLLENTGEVLTDMLASDDHRLAVRYGIWQPTQTVVILSSPYPGDHLRVLNRIQEKTVSIQPDRATVAYQGSIASGGHEEPIYAFRVEEIDTVKQTDATVSAMLLEESTPILDLSRYSHQNTPRPLVSTTGLDPAEVTLGSYLQVDLDIEHLQSGTVEMFYHASALDRNGDGDADDPGDIDETSLVIYRYNETLGRYEKLTGGSEDIHEIGADPEDFEMYGNRYAGKAWVTGTGFSLFALAGTVHNQPPDLSGVFPSVERLWPPDMKIREVSILGATDPDGDPVGITITAITSDEPAGNPRDEPGKEKKKKNEKGRQDTSVDAFGVETETAYLRAERQGDGNGRIFAISFLASDGRGGEAEGTVQVCVPHDQGAGHDDCIDDGQVYEVGIVGPPQPHPDDS